MILRPHSIAPLPVDGDNPARRALGDAGGLTQLGVYLQTLQPGEASSNRHWHAHVDEFLYVVAGEIVVVEDDGPHVLHPGDAAAWPAGDPNAHQVVNQSNAPATYVIVGTRMARDVVTYPDSGEVLHDDNGRYTLLRDGEVLAEGVIEQRRPLDWASSQSSGHAERPSPQGRLPL